MPPFISIYQSFLTSIVTEPCGHGHCPFIINKFSCFLFHRHAMPRSKRTRELSEASHVVETLAAGSHVLRSHTKQTTVSFPVMSGNNKIPATMSQSTPSKTDVQQLLAKISPVVIHNALRRFREKQPTINLLVKNWSSPVISLSRIPAPKQGTVKLSSSLPHGVIPEGEFGRKLPPPPPSGPSSRELAEESTTAADSGLGPEPSRLSQEYQEPSVSLVAKASSLSR